MPSIGLQKRIERFYISINRLKKLSNYNKENILSDFKISDSIERNLQITIQSLIDIGNFIISKLEFEPPTKYKDIAFRLYQNKLLNKEEFEIFSKIIGFRHILVHFYSDIIFDEVYEILKNKIIDLEQIMNKLLLIIRNKKLDP